MHALRRLHPPIDFMVQAINCSSLGFETQTRKSSLRFWGANHQTVAAGFEAQTRKAATTSLEAKPGETVTSDFEDKTGENRRHWF
jgi:hypothetical protein